MKDDESDSETNIEEKHASAIAQKHGTSKVVIIASRRTDMPAFYTDELINGLKNGEFHPQPMMQKIWKFTFKPEQIHSVGLWSQDFSKWLLRPELTELRSIYKFWYRFSILPDDPVCKPKAPSVQTQLDQLENLVKAEGSQKVFLFIDPLIAYRKLGESQWLYNFSRQSLENIFSKAAALGISAVTTSIIDYYPKVERRAMKRGYEFRKYDPENVEDQKEMKEMIRIFTEAAQPFGIKVKTCSEKYFNIHNLAERGTCVDGRKLNELFGPGASTKCDSAQRIKYGCGCTAAVDIGRYTGKGNPQWSHQCYHDCIQCYARK